MATARLHDGSALDVAVTGRRAGGPAAGRARPSPTARRPSRCGPGAPTRISAIPWPPASPTPACARLRPTTRAPRPAPQAAHAHRRSGRGRPARHRRRGWGGPVRLLRLLLARPVGPAARDPHRPAHRVGDGRFPAVGWSLSGDAGRDPLRPPPGRRGSGPATGPPVELRARRLGECGDHPDAGPDPAVRHPLRVPCGLYERAALDGSHPAVGVCRRERHHHVRAQMGQRRRRHRGAPATHRDELGARGWTVELLPDVDHMGAMHAARVLPFLIPWLMARPAS